MNKRKTIIIAVIVILSALPFTLNIIIINMYFENLDTEIYEKKKARVEQRRQIEKMFPELKDADKLTVNEE